MVFTDSNPKGGGRMLLMRICSAIFLLFGLFSPEVAGQKVAKEGAMTPCADRSPKVVNGAEVPCMSLAMPVSKGEEVDAWYQEDNKQALLDAWDANRGTIEMAQYLADKDKNRTAELSLAILRTKKAVDALCWRFRCEGEGREKKKKGTK